MTGLITLDVFICSLAVGALSGILAGLFGLGGGLIFVPGLVWILSWQQFAADTIMITAVATSLAAVVPTSIASVMTHHKLRAVHWPRVFKLSPGILIGAGLGALIADFIDGQTLRWTFVIYLIYVAVAMAVKFKPASAGTRLPNWLDYPAGLCIGGLSSLLGIGGGTLTVPYLTAQKLDMKRAVAISSACGLPISVSGTIVFSILGSHSAELPEASVGYIYLPAWAGLISLSIVTAPYGARLAHRLPAQRLKRYFSIVLLLVAIKMIFK